MSDRVRTSVLFSALLCLAACGGGSGATTPSKCAEGTTSTTSCVASSNPSCAASGGTLVAMCSGGQWSACSCSVASTTGNQSTAGATATGAPAVSVCGNGKAEGEEQCDATDLKGMSCATLGMGAATAMLKCNARCTFDTLLCLSAAPTTGSGGTGAGGTGARTTGTAGAGGSGR